VKVTFKKKPTLTLTEVSEAFRCALYGGKREWGGGADEGRMTRCDGRVIR